MAVSGSTSNRGARGGGRHAVLELARGNRGSGEGVRTRPRGDDAVRSGLRPQHKLNAGRRDRDAHRGDDIPVRCSLDGVERGGDRLGLPLRELEEPRQDVAPVLGRQDLREFDDARETEAPVAKRLDDLRELLDELGRGLAVVGGALREPELPVQEVEQRGGAPGKAWGRRMRELKLSHGPSGENPLGKGVATSRKPSVAWSEGDLGCEAYTGSEQAA